MAPFWIVFALATLSLAVNGSVDEEKLPSELSELQDHHIPHHRKDNDVSPVTALKELDIGLDTGEEKKPYEVKAEKKLLKKLLRKGLITPETAQMLEERLLGTEQDNEVSNPFMFFEPDVLRRIEKISKKAQKALARKERKIQKKMNRKRARKARKKRRKQRQKRKQKARKRRRNNLKNRQKALKKRQKTKKTSNTDVQIKAKTTSGKSNRGKDKRTSRKTVRKNTKKKSVKSVKRKTKSTPVKAVSGTKSKTSNRATRRKAKKISGKAGQLKIDQGPDEADVSIRQDDHQPWRFNVDQTHTIIPQPAGRSRDGVIQTWIPQVDNLQNHQSNVRIQPLILEGSNSHSAQVAYNEEAPAHLAHNEEATAHLAYNEEAPAHLAYNEEAPAHLAHNEEAPASLAYNEEAPAYLAHNEEAPTHLAYNEEDPESGYQTDVSEPSQMLRFKRSPAKDRGRLPMLLNRQRPSVDNGDEKVGSSETSGNTASRDDHTSGESDNEKLSQTKETQQEHDQNSGQVKADDRDRTNVKNQDDKNSGETRTDQLGIKTQSINSQQTDTKSGENTDADKSGEQDEKTQSEEQKDKNTSGEDEQKDNTGVIQQVNVFDTSNEDKSDKDKIQKMTTNTIKKVKNPVLVKTKSPKDASGVKSKMEGGNIRNNRLQSAPKQNSAEKRTGNVNSGEKTSSRNKVKSAGIPKNLASMRNTGGDGLANRKGMVDLNSVEPKSGPLMRQGDETGSVGVPITMCTCLVSGDPHYYLFDGQVIHFTGNCIYTLSRSIASDVPCAFNVEVTNEYRDGLDTVSYTRSVTVQALGITISLQTGRRVVVNDVLLIPPLSLADGGIKVTIVGYLVEVYLVNCGIRVAFDGSHLVRVQIPSGQGNDVTGLCGNCNDLQDDYRLINDQDVSLEPDKFSMIADSYAVSEGCMSSERSATCKNESLAMTACTAAIGQPVFATCVSLLSVKASQVTASCVMDYCQWQNDVNKLEAVICKTLESLAALCREEGQAVSWRTPQLCPATCTDSQYLLSVSGCQPSCVIPSAPEVCELGAWEGCACDVGKYLSGTGCVDLNDCGCDRNNFKFPLGHVVVTSPCETELTCQAGGTWGKESLGKCVDNAVCDLVDGERTCTCRTGFLGDGYSNCTLTDEGQEETGILDIVKPEHLENCKYCRISGDPHYNTFDGEMADFMGACKYTLVKSTIQNDPCAFNIEVKNERRYGLSEVSFTKFVDLEIFGLAIRLGLNNTLYINGERRYPPVTITDSLVVTHSAYLQIDTSCGVHVEFDGVHQIVIRIPQTYKNNVVGICGNANDNPDDDFILKNGSDVFAFNDRDSLVGYSFVVPDDSITQAQINGGETVEECLVMEVNPDCDDNGLTIARDKCGIIIDPDDVFSQCAPLIGEVELHKFFESCVYDLCTFESHSLGMDDQLCKNLEAVSSKCSQHGLSLSWRNSYFCPMFCEEGSHYNPEMSGCQATITDPIPLLECPLLNREGCQCDVGYLLSGTTCVQEKQRGCQDNDNNYFPIGTGYTSRDCRNKFVCEDAPTGAYFSSQVYMTCDINANCVPVDGDLTCQCISGYTGNGITCTRDTPPADQTPRANTCDCMVTSDRFYHTFDGQLLDFQGDCTYILSHHDNTNNDCIFTVTVSNFNTGQDNFYRSIDVMIYGLTITIGPSYHVKVDGFTHYLPVVVADMKVTVTLSGRILTLVADCGLTVSFDGDDLVSVQVDTDFMNQLNGLCGDCDGVANDFIMEDGTDLTNDPEKSSKMANYYRTGDESCLAHEVFSTCTPTDITSAEGNDVCGLLSGTSGLFQTCLDALPEGGNWIKETCVVDLCTPPGDKCDFYEALVLSCAQYDEPITKDWRQDVQCQLDCGQDQRYSSAMSGCQGNCLFPAPLSCPLPTSEGCECIPGTVLSNTECVAYSECGCRDTSGLKTYPIDASYTTDTCSQLVTCTRFVLGFMLQITSLPPCVDGATCALVNGDRECVCDGGSIGDGTTSCTAVAATPTQESPARLPQLLNAEPQTANSGNQATTQPPTETLQSTTQQQSQTIQLSSATPEVTTTSDAINKQPLTTPQHISQQQNQKEAHPTTERQTFATESTEPPSRLPELLNAEPQTSNAVTVQPSAPVAAQQPITTLEPVAAQQPITTPMPVAAQQPTTTPKPVAAQQPFTTPKPVAAQQPTTTPKPVAAQQPITTPEPVAAQQPTTAPEPVTAQPPTTAAQQTTTIPERVAAQQPTTAPEPVTAQQTTTIPEPVAAQQPTTTTEPVGAQQPTTAPKPEAAQQSNTTTAPEAAQLHTTPQTQDSTPSDRPVPLLLNSHQPDPEPPCACSVKGDPHYISYDRAFINIFCPCKYVVSESEVNGSDCNFRIEGRNEFRPGPRPDKAYVEYIDIIIGGEVVTLERHLRAKVNGVPVTFPTQTASGELTLRDKNVYFTSNCGLVVHFDGIQRAYITAPARYRNIMTGICGNCDGSRHDDVQVEGTFDNHIERDKVLAKKFLIVEESNTHPDCQLPT